jgi:hypothetical protein
MADAPDTWHRGLDEEKPSYIGEMLTSQTNINVGLASLAAAAVAAIPLGLAGAAIPLVLFGAGEAIASMFVPSSQTFRNLIDRRFRAKKRAAFVEHLRKQIEHLARRDHDNWGIHQRMLDRVSSINDLRQHRKDVISERDLERLEDASMDYLSLWLTQLSIEDRLDSLGASGINKQLYVTEERLKKNPDDVTLRKAKADLEELVERAERLKRRKTVVDTSLLALPDAVEEIYTAAITSPTAGDVASRLQEAVDRLHVEQELDSKLDAELGGVSLRMPQAASNRASAAAAAASAVKH